MLKINLRFFNKYFDYSKIFANIAIDVESIIRFGHLRKYGFTQVVTIVVLY
jgi:hypothetical protein